MTVTNENESAPTHNDASGDQKSAADENLSNLFPPPPRVGGPGIDLEEAHRFLNRLDGDGRFGFRVFDDNNHRKDRRLIFNHYGQLANISEKLARFNERGAGVFFTVNELDRNGFKAENVTRVRAVFVDLDGALLDPVLEGPLEPHIVVETSPGRFHVYWLVDGLPLDNFEAVQRALAERFDGDPSVKDLPRVMRLPGFLHRKAEPFRTRILSEHSRPGIYDAANILATLNSESVRAKSRGRAKPIPQVIPEGERETRLTSLAGSLRYRGLSADEIHDALVSVNKRCQPPLPDEDLRRISKSIGKKPTGANNGFVTRRGAIVASNQGNIRMALARVGAAVSYNEFADRLLIRRDGGSAHPLDDATLDRLWLQIDAELGFRPTEGFFRTVVADHARANAFHPVRDYLDGLTWDGTPRLDTWLLEYGGAADSDYTLAISVLVMIAAVRRVRQPGVKFDEMVVLESPQGTNKSSALATLCPDPSWFTDDLPLNVSAKEVMERTSGKWIVEAAELSGLRKGDVEHLKAFLSRQVDRARLSYGRTTTERARHFVVVGTTNSDAYLKDSTGNRRFWPLRISGFDLERLRRDRDQLWAEAAHREAAGASIRLDPDLWPLAELQQDRRRIDDPWEHTLENVLSDLNGKLLVEDAWQIVGMIDRSRRTQHDNGRLGEAVRRIGFKRERRRHEGKLRWHYVRGSQEETNRRIVVEVTMDDNGRPVGHPTAHLEDGGTPEM